MTDDNVLFLRGNGNDANAVNEDAWDDSALIKAYDAAVNLAKEEVAKRMGIEAQNSQVKQKPQGSKEFRNTSKQCKKWTVGAPCRAVYSEDGEEYEAIISKIYENSGTCIVKFVGYGNTEKVELSALLESEGLQSQISQQKDALAKRSDEEHVDSDTTAFSSNINSRKCNGEKMDCESMETKTYKHSFMSGPSFFDSGTDIIPPAPPLPPQLMANLPHDDADALSSMLMSWYISGFHTGYYHGLKQARCNQKKGKDC